MRNWFCACMSSTGIRPPPKVILPVVKSSRWRGSRSGRAASGSRRRRQVQSRCRGWQGVHRVPHQCRDHARRCRSGRRSSGQAPEVSIALSALVTQSCEQFLDVSGGLTCFTLICASDAGSLAGTVIAAFVRRISPFRAGAPNTPCHREGAIAVAAKSVPST